MKSESIIINTKISRLVVTKMFILGIIGIIVWRCKFCVFQIIEYLIEEKEAYLWFMIYLYSFKVNLEKYVIY